MNHYGNYKLGKLIFSQPSLSHKCKQHLLGKHLGTLNMNENSQSTLSRFCSIYSKQKNGTERRAGGTVRKVHTAFSRPKRSNKSHNSEKRNCLIQVVLDAKFQRGSVTDMSAVKHFSYGIVMVVYSSQGYPQNPRDSVLGKAS